MADIINGANLARAFTDVLNEICKSEGHIQDEDMRIWGIIHNMTDKEWDDLLSTLEQLEQYDPGIFYPQDSSLLDRARTELDKSIAHGRSFVGAPKNPKSGHKYTVWRLWMIMREVINRHNGVNIPNKPPQRTQPPKPGNTFQEIFQ